MAVLLARLVLAVGCALVSGVALAHTRACIARAVPAAAARAGQLRAVRAARVCLAHALAMDARAMPAAAVRARGGLVAKLAAPAVGTDAPAARDVARAMATRPAALQTLSRLAGISCPALGTHARAVRAEAAAVAIGEVSTGADGAAEARPSGFAGTRAVGQAAAPAVARRRSRASLALARKAGPPNEASALALIAHAAARAVETDEVVGGTTGGKRVLCAGREREQPRRARHAAADSASRARRGNRAVGAAVAVAAHAHAAGTALAAAGAVVEARWLVAEGASPAGEAMAHLRVAFAPTVGSARRRVEVEASGAVIGAGARTGKQASDGRGGQGGADGWSVHGGARRGSSSDRLRLSR